jgi:hypothetical protein
MVTQTQNPGWRAGASHDFAGWLVAFPKYPAGLVLATHYGALLPAAVDGAASLLAYIWEGVR